MLIAGIGRSDITPPIGIAHAGWGASTHECAEGIDMPLYCTALYMANGDTQALIIDFDLTGVTEPLDSQIRQAASEASGVPGDNIRISSTHTHAAPAFGGPWLVEGVDLLERFFAELPAKTAAAALAAAKSAVPATVGAATGECGININRRPADTGGRLFTGRNWDGYVDPEVLVLGFDDAKGRTDRDGTSLRLPSHRAWAGKQVAFPRLSRPRPARGGGKYRRAVPSFSRVRRVTRDLSTALWAT